LPPKRGKSFGLFAGIQAFAFHALTAELVSKAKEKGFI
jgi:hypothetical protein